MKYIFPSDEVEWKVKGYVEAGVHHKGRWKDIIKENVNAKKFVVQLFEFAPGGSTDPHYHNSESEQEQMYYVLSGKALVRVGDEERIVEKDWVVFVPPNTTHSYRVVGDEPFIFLNVSAPAESTTVEVKTGLKFQTFYHPDFEKLGIKKD